MDFSLEPIFEYEMTSLQAKAYKLGLQWLVLSRKEFPNYLHDKGYPKKGDPRRSLLFKCCYKVIRETQGLIPDNEYKLFIKAQLDILKSITIGDRHPRIGPMCLAGDKAWVRWKMWKQKYDKIVKKGQTKEDVNLDVVPLPIITKELLSTKTFLEGRFEGIIKEEHIMMAHKDIERWVSIGKVSGFYAVLSPWVQKYCKSLSIDIDLYNKSITPEVRDFFNKHFGA